MSEQVVSKGLCTNAEGVGKILGVSRKTAYELVNRDDFPKIRIGRRILVPIAGLERWVDDQAAACSGR